MEKQANSISLQLIYVLLSPLVPIGIRYLSLNGMDNITQNYIRFGSGAAAILLITLIFFRKDLVVALRTPRVLVMLAAFSFAGSIAQYASVEGLSRVSAAMGGLIAIMGIPLTLVLATIFYHDEREITTNRRFIIGMSIAIAGTIGIGLAAPGAKLTYSIGILWLFFAITIGSFSTVFLKHLLTTVHPFAAGTITSLLLTIQFLVLSLATGQLGNIADVPLKVVVIAILSGVQGLVLGIGLHFVLMKYIGISRMNVWRLVIPVFTAILGYFLIGDKLSLGQMAFGLVVLFGCWLCFFGRRKLEEC